MRVLVLSPTIALAQVSPPRVTQELSPVRNIAIQDSVKLPQDKKTNAPGTEIQTQPPRVTSRSNQSSTPGALSRLGFRDARFPELTIHVIDSLGILYPELKDYLLEQAFILGVLQIDLAERDRKKLLDRAFADLRIPSELESKLRRNLAVYGTTENPMKPPPSPYQVNLFDAISALSNLLQYLGVK